MGAVNGKQFLEMLARLPARVWLQAILGLIGFIVLAVLGFAVIAGVAAVIVIAILALKARQWLRGLWESGSADAELRRWLLAPLSAPPGGATINTDRTLCNCMNVSQSKVRAGIERGLDLTGLKQELGCGTSCGSCVPEIKRLLASQPERALL